MIMKVAKEPDPPWPLGLSYVLNIETFEVSMASRIVREDYVYYSLYLSCPCLLLDQRAKAEKVVQE